MEDILIVVVLIAVCIDIVITLTVKSKNNSANTEGLEKRMDWQVQSLMGEINRLSEDIRAITKENSEQLIKIQNSFLENADRQTARVHDAVQSMQKSNEQKLDQMRGTVEEKLTETLNRRINNSFETVSKQLENVYKGLGEMKELSSGVTDSVNGLNRVLTNVKVRGTWAELQLKNILDETIPGMYETNVKTNPSYNGQVEFAVKIPAGDDDGSYIYLPIDSKFPMEDYIRLTEISESGNAEETERARKALERAIKAAAAQIKKYICDSGTTPFAIMYLATEGLYGEAVSSRSGLAEELQRLGIMLAGPSTVTALLNSLAVGFKTLAINRKAGEVWNVLGEAKGQYSKFGDLIAKAKKKVKEAENVLDDAEFRNDQIQKKLSGVESLELPEKG